MRKLSQRLTVFLLLTFTALTPEELLFATDFRLGPAETANVTLAHTYYFVVREYVPPIPVHAGSKPRALLLDTPEGATLAFYSAMLRGDYEGWLAVWDSESRKAILERNTKKGRDAQYWIERWKEGFGSHSDFKLMRRVDTEGFVIIEIRASGAGIGRKPLFQDLPLKRDQDGKWYTTNAFGTDPVFVNWRTPEVPMEKIVREPPKLQ